MTLVEVLGVAWCKMLIILLGSILRSISMYRVPVCPYRTDLSLYGLVEHPRCHQVEYTAREAPV
jgi:hypothetical protein